MELFTEAQFEQLIKNGRDRNPNKDQIPVVKLFMSFTACSWLISELDPEDPDIAFGLCDLGMGFPEIGYVSISELIEAQDLLRFLERDMFFLGKYPLSVYAKFAHQLEHIETDDDAGLRRIKNAPRP